MAIVTTGLELSLDASNPASYSGTGINWNDLSGNGNNFILAGEPFWDSSGFFSLTTNQYAFKFGVANLTRWAAADYTLCYWVYNSSFTSAGAGPTRPGGVGNSEPNGGIQYWSFGTDAAGLVSLYYFNGATQTISTTTTLTLNTWNHLSFTQSGGVVNIYVNANLVHTATVIGTPQYSVDGYPFSISAQAGAYIQGAIFTAQVYEIALNGTQILQNYSAAIPPDPNGTALISQESALTLTQVSPIVRLTQASIPVLTALGSGAGGSEAVTQASAPTLINAIPDGLVVQTSISFLIRSPFLPSIIVNVSGVDATAILGEAEAFAQTVIIPVFGVAGFGRVNPVGSVVTTRDVIIDAESVFGVGSVAFPTVRWYDVDVYEVSDWVDVPHQRGSYDN